MAAWFAPVAAAAIGGGASMAGSGMTNNSAKKLNRKAREFEQYMRSTAHQVEVEDLRKAGLNPILSAGGSGAVSHSVPAPSLADYGHSLSSGINSGLALASTRADLQVKKAEVATRNMDVTMQEGMMDWLKQNPGYQDLIFSGMLAKHAGLNPSVYAPLMGWNSAAVNKRVGGRVEWLGDKLLGRLQGFLNDAVKRSLKADRGNDLYLNPPSPLNRDGTLKR